MDDMPLPGIEMGRLDQVAAEDRRQRVLVGKVEITERGDRQVDMLPLSLPVLATAAIFSFIWTWDDFFGPLIYLNDMNTYTIQLGLRTFVDSTSASDWGGLFAMISTGSRAIFRMAFTLSSSMSPPPTPCSR